jgi:hypothetical protein
MTIPSETLLSTEAVKQHYLEEATQILGSLFDFAATETGLRDIELEVWRGLLKTGQLLLTTLLERLCMRATEADIEERELKAEDVRLRLDQDYWNGMNTTLGRIHFPLYAYRDYSSGLCVTHTPARQQVLPLRKKCQSSELLLEWEARLGSALPFRHAQEALEFFSHGALSLEDTTIARHTVAIGAAIDRQWLYRPLIEIQELLSERAARDRETGKPVVYLSTDAHAERVYDDETWEASWLMINGIRLWTVDRRTGDIIHLGGEYTWGDCHEVASIIGELVGQGYLPEGGDYGDVPSELVVVVDGMPWFEEHILSQLPWSHSILDLFHALEHLGRYATARFGKGKKTKKKRRSWYRRLAKNLVAQPQSKPARNRKGHTKSKPGTVNSRVKRHRRRVGSGLALLDALYEEDAKVPKKAREKFDKLLNYFEHNEYRMDYDRYRARGWEIGSGAMESLHRVAGQVRLKIPGARWLKETSQAILNLRMLTLVERWGEFWSSSNLQNLLLGAFGVEGQNSCG